MHDRSFTCALSLGAVGRNHHSAAAAPEARGKGGGGRKRRGRGREEVPKQAAWHVRENPVVLFFYNDVIHKIAQQAAQPEESRGERREERSNNKGRESTQQALACIGKPRCSPVVGRAVVATKMAEQEGALRSQLEGLEAQREKLEELVGEDGQSPLIPLQVCTSVTHIMLV